MKTVLCFCAALAVAVLCGPLFAAEYHLKRGDGSPVQDNGLVLKDGTVVMPEDYPGGDPWNVEYAPQPQVESQSYAPAPRAIRNFPKYQNRYRPYQSRQPYYPRGYGYGYRGGCAGGQCW